MAGADETFPTSLQVIVTPLQAAFFAGEPLTVTISITNTLPSAAEGAAPFTTIYPPGSPTPTFSNSKNAHGRSLSAAPSPRYAHKRSSHSVSHVPIAHPPTSPGIGQARHASSSSLSLPTPSSRLVIEEAKAIRRKNQIGVNIQNGRMVRGDGIIRKGKDKLGVDVVQLHSLLIPDKKSDLLRGVREDTRLAADTSPRISSPLTRDSTVPQSHPHARKQSLLDDSFSPSLYDTSASPLAPGPSSTPKFSTSFDSIAESSKSDDPSPSFAGYASVSSHSAAPSPSYQHISAPSSEPQQSVSYPEPPSTPRTAPILSLSSKRTNGVSAPSQAALGYGHPQQPFTAIASVFPRSPGHAAPSDGSEFILYSYVHFSGMVALNPPPVDEHAWVEMMCRMRVRKRTRGGGSMDITAMSPQAALSRPSGHTRRSSMSASLWGLLSPSLTLPVSPDAPSRSVHRVRPSTSSPISTPAPRGLGLGIESVNGALSTEEDVDAPMTVFEVPNAMLGIDMRLEPGESKSWTYTVNLPDWLPPTYSGKSIRFTYQLAIGTCRALPGGSNSRVMKVPVRVYNHVSVDKVVTPYNLLRNAETGTVAKLAEENAKLQSGVRAAPLPQRAAASSTSSLQAYGERLLVPPVSLEDTLSSGDVEAGQDSHAALTGCREAVEILTRMPKRVTYEVQKAGINVAVLTFTKAAWRLGETIHGVVEMNSRNGRTQVLKLSAYLEAHETLPSPPTGTTPVVGIPDAKLTRRVYAEDHASVLSCTLRTSFALDIPSDAAPAFSIRLSDSAPRANGTANDPCIPATSQSANTEGGVEWKVRVCLLVCAAPEGARVRGIRRHGEEGEWGTSYIPISTPICQRPAPPSALRQTESTSSWTEWFTSTFVTPTAYHDGDDDHSDESETKPESDTESDDHESGGWEEMRTEMVECEVPVRVWPGNTAFRAMDVIFDV